MNESHLPHIAALAGIGDEFRVAAPLPEAFSEISRLYAEQVSVDLDGNVTIRDATGAIALDPAKDWQPMTPAGWVANLRRTRRDLFERDEKPVSKAKPATLGESMLAAKHGDPSALAEFEERYRLPQVASKVNMTELWAKAKAGDVAARQKLESILKV